MVGLSASNSETGEAETRTAMLTGLEELIIVVGIGFYDYQTDDGKYIDFDEETVEKLKQQYHDKIVLRFQNDSAITKIPEITVVRGREFNLWTRWEEPPQPVGLVRGGYEVNHRDDCHRLPIKGRRVIHGEL